MLSRRSLLAALAIPAAAAKAAGRLALDPVTADLVALPDPDGRAPPVLLPASRAWIAFAGLLSGAHFIAVQFTLEQCVFVAFCGGHGFSLQGVQLWHARDRSAEYGSMLRIAGDGSLVALVHDWARLERPGLWQREHWTDRFAWDKGGGLSELSTHPPANASVQAHFAASRAASAALLPYPARFVPDAAIRLQTDSFSLGSKAQPSMRQTPSDPRSIE
jgi:hypothetical protein